MASGHYAEFYEQERSPDYWENKRRARDAEEERTDFAIEVLRDFVQGRKKVETGRAMEFVAAEVARRYGSYYGEREARIAFWTKLNRAGYWRFDRDRSIVAC